MIHPCEINPDSADGLHSYVLARRDLFHAFASGLGTRAFKLDTALSTRHILGRKVTTEDVLDMIRDAYSEEPGAK